jgi:hypothetical protein
MGPLVTAPPRAVLHRQHERADAVALRVLLVLDPLLEGKTRERAVVELEKVLPLVALGVAVQLVFVKKQRLENHFFT